MVIISGISPRPTLQSITNPAINSEKNHVSKFALKLPSSSTETFLVKKQPPAIFVSRNQSEIDSETAIDALITETVLVRTFVQVRSNVFRPSFLILFLCFFFVRLSRRCHENLMSGTP